MLHGPCPDGEQERLGGGCGVDVGRRTSRTGRGLAMASRLPGGRRRVTLGADKGYDTQAFVEVARVERDAACGAEHVGAPQPDRRAHDAPRELHASARGNANEWKKSSVGSRRRRGYARHAIEAATESDGCSPLPRRLTTWYG